jgi:HSP20 family protein
MRFRETLPWNWGKKEIPVEREMSATSLPASRSVFDVLEELRSHPFAMPSFPTLPGFGFADDGSFLPTLDAQETDEEIRITVELPGLEEKDVQVRLRDDILSISGEKRDETKHEEGGAQWVERRFGSFRRAIPLPPDVDPEAVTAHFKSGVLTITAPRTGKPEEEHRTIPIHTG